MSSRSFVPRGFSPVFLRVGGLTVATWLAASCNSIGTERVISKSTTLGDDLYGLVCDRLGASSFTEDLTGASYQAICHSDDKDHGTKVDLTALPSTSAAREAEARRLSVAKLERLAARRHELVQAINAVFPDTTMPDRLSTVPGARVHVHDALFDLAQTLFPLYESNPLAPGTEPPIPAQSRALSRLLDGFAKQGTCAGTLKACTVSGDCGDGGVCTSPARDALSRTWGRRGYRPLEASLGVFRPALAYPGLRDVLKTAIGVLGPRGSGAAELQQVFAVAKQELATSTATVSPLPGLAVDPATDQPNRPRSTTEVATAFFLAQDAAHAASPLELPRYIAKRDRRGFVVPAFGVPGKRGSVSAPFADVDGDGYADVDAFGRFIDAWGLPIALDLPFAVPGVSVGDVDAFGRPVTSAASYSYLDTARTVASGLLHQVVPLLDATVIAPDDPDAWQREHETLMYALSGATLLSGGRETMTFDYASQGPAGQAIRYNRFRSEDSPFPDLAHAIGQILADEDSDVLLQALLDLLENHEAIVARLVGAALRVREIVVQHDTLADQGIEPRAGLAYEVPVWDEIGAVVGRIAQRPGLVQGLLGALADDVVVAPKDGALHMGDALAKLATYRDELTYNPHDINGPAVNVTVAPAGGDSRDPETPVDPAQPRNGKNVSILERTLRLLHDVDGGPACNKAGARIALSGSLSWPIWPAPAYAECELLQIQNLAQFYLDSMLPPNHPRRTAFQLKSATLNDVMAFLGNFTDPGVLLQSMSGIKGLTLQPSTPALTRLVFFGATSDLYPAMPDLDLVNRDKGTDRFIRELLEPVSPVYCPPDAAGVPVCADKAATLRIRDGNTAFALERFGMMGYLRPVVTAFANASCPRGAPSCDKTRDGGELLFLDLLQVLNRHYPGSDHGQECSTTDRGRYCSEAGLNRYEPIVADAVRGDLLPALHEFAKVATQQSAIPVKRGPKRGENWPLSKAIEKLARILFDPTYAATTNMVDRRGNTATTWVNGSPQPQLTGFSLLADAFHKVDVRFATACDCIGFAGRSLADCRAKRAACGADAAQRKGQWTRARSQLVDAFFGVDGEGPSASFRNPSLKPMLVTGIGLLREQLNGSCPDRESTGSCAYARRDLGFRLARAMDGPLFAALMDAQETVRKDEPARRKVETFLQALADGMNRDGQLLSAVLASTNDLFQLLTSDRDTAPILNALAAAMSAADDPRGAGVVNASLNLLKALTDDRYDRYHLIDQILPNLVTPMNGGSSLSPLEVAIDVFADVNRIDASDKGPLSADDYQTLATTLRELLSDKTRGLERFYAVLKKRSQP